MATIIEKLKIDQIHILQKIARKSFSETFATMNSESDMDNYLTNNLSLAQLTLEFNNPETEFYMAKIEKEYVGYLKVNCGNAQHEFQENKGLEIERIYVLQKFHRQKIGQALYEQALYVAQQKNMDYVWLGVWEKNQKAISFYQKNGFVVFDQHIFQLGTDKQIDILMKYTLQ